MSTGENWYKTGKKLLAALNPQQLGLRFEPVREQALKAAEQSQDFGELFLGFSIFLVVASLLLMALLFQFGLEQRVTEIGVFAALGFTQKRIRRLLLGEAAALATIGAMMGAVAGMGYAWALLWGLNNMWSGATGGARLHFHATAMTLLIGIFSSVVAGLAAMFLTFRRLGRQPATELLAGTLKSGPAKGGRRGKWVAIGSGLGGVGLAGYSLVSADTANPEIFFTAGALILIAGLGGMSVWLNSLARRSRARHMTPGSLAMRSCSRRIRRSLATAVLLASGCFVIVALGVFHLDANRQSSDRRSGTGGFAFVGESTVPLVHDLNSKSGREYFGLNEADMAGVNVVSLRVRDGDDASCLNLTRAQQPRVLGVKPELLLGRFTFQKVAKGHDGGSGWGILRRRAGQAPDEISAIGDANSIQWALGRKVGDVIEYAAGGGRTVKLRLVGALANSMLQGNLLIDEEEFIRLFPSESGYRMLLIECSRNSQAIVSGTLSRGLRDNGLELASAVDRLNAFNAVQNTYLGTFQVLGGLGLLLGSAGLGIVVLRNVLERRAELGLLLAVGLRRRLLHRLILTEHAVLLLFGLGIGVVGAVIAVMPSLVTPGSRLPYGSLAVTLTLVLINGLFWTWAATRLALRGDLLAALRNE
jgi:hypothetical protein